MIREIRIKNFAIIDELNIEFDKGFNVFTGETGAGKSIIVDAISLLIGGRSDVSLIRTGEETASVEGIFEINNRLRKKIRKFLDDRGIEMQGEELLIKRDINTSGKNRCFINNNITTVSILKSMGEFLVDIHGQHEHQSLLNQANHINVLDSFAKNEVLNENVSNIYNEIKSLMASRETLIMDEKEKQRKTELFNYQISEIEEANLKDLEEDELNNEKIRLSNAEKLFSLVSDAYSNLYGDENNDGIVSKLEKCIASIRSISDIDSAISDTVEGCEKSKLELDEVVHTLRDYKEKIEFNPKRLDEIENRLNLIVKLKKKYALTGPSGNTIKDILEHKERLKKELNQITNAEEEIREIDEKLKELYLKYDKASKELSEKRKKSASILNKKIEEELKNLNMQKASFKVNIEKLQEISPIGVDMIEFLICTNPGEGFKQLAKIASGGEMSRIMLAIKTILADVDDVFSLVFDEVDSGIGGRIAEVVGKKLKDLVVSHQVLCITHLAQIACFSDKHFFIEKTIKNNRVKVNVKVIDGKDKVEEIAKMISGDKISAVSIKHAEELLDKSK